MLLAFDLDNTLVTEDNRLSAATARAVQAARRAGHHISVLTGRTQASAQPFLELLEVDSYYSVNHGALVVGEQGEQLHRAMLSAPEVHALIARYQGYSGVEYACIVDETLYVGNPDDPRWQWVHTQNHFLEPFSPDTVRQADKVVFSCGLQGQRIHDDICVHFPHLVRYLWRDNFLEIAAADAHKAAALARLCRVLGYSPADTIAFGDGINDVTMIAWAGYGVAVSDLAHPDVLAVADEHIAAPEQEGVSRWLHQHLLPKASAA